MNTFVFLITSKWAQRCILAGGVAGLSLILVSGRSFSLAEAALYLGIAISITSAILLLLSDKLHKHYCTKSQTSYLTKVHTTLPSRLYITEWPLLNPLTQGDWWILQEDDWINPTIEVQMLVEIIGNKHVVRKEITSVEIRAEEITTKPNSIKDAALDGGLLLLIFVDGVADGLFEKITSDLRSVSLVDSKEAVGLKAISHNKARITYVGLIVEERVFSIKSSGKALEICFPNE